MKSKSKKTNPRRRPLSEADVPKIRDEAIHLAFAIFLTVLKDNFDFDNDQIVFAWERADALSKSASGGWVNIWDLVSTLKEEYNIDLVE